MDSTTNVTQNTDTLKNADAQAPQTPKTGRVSLAGLKILAGVLTEAAQHLEAELRLLRFNELVLPLITTPAARAAAKIHLIDLLETVRVQRDLDHKRILAACSLLGVERACVVGEDALAPGDGLEASQLQIEAPKAAMVEYTQNRKRANEEASKIVAAWGFEGLSL